MMRSRLTGLGVGGPSMFAKKDASADCGASFALFFPLQVVQVRSERCQTAGAAISQLD